MVYVSVVKIVTIEVFLSNNFTLAIGGSDLNSFLNETC